MLGKVPEVPQVHLRRPRVSLLSELRGLWGLPTGDTLPNHAARFPCVWASRSSRKLNMTPLLAESATKDLTSFTYASQGWLLCTYRQHLQANPSYCWGVVISLVLVQILYASKAATVLVQVL